MLTHMLHTVSITEPEALDQALKALYSGSTLIYPTETCYGLGCDARNSAAVDRIFKIKVREPGKAVLVLVHDISIIMKYVEWNETIDELARTYWPGPLTIIAPLKTSALSELATGVVGEDSTLAFRVTSHPFAASLAQSLKAPIVSTSANISSYSNPYDIHYITSMFDGREYVPDLIVDAGNLPHHSPSTIVKVEVDGSKTILRQGEIIIE